MRTHFTTQRRRDDRGSAVLEFIFVAPILMALIVAIAQFGFYFSKKVEVTSAARDAARTVALGGTPTYPAGMSGSVGQTCAAGDTTNDAIVTVTLTGGYTFSIAPLVALGNKSITATGRMRCGG